MSNYCRTCCRELFGSERSDFEGLVTKEDWELGYCARVLCERCGWAEVGPDGDCNGTCTPLVRLKEGEHCPSVPAPTLPADVPGVPILMQPGNRVKIAGKQPTRFDPQAGYLWVEDREICLDMPVHKMFRGIGGVIEIADIFETIVTDGINDSYEEVLVARTHATVERSPAGPIVWYQVKFHLPVRACDIVWQGTSVEEEYLLPD